MDAFVVRANGPLSGTVRVRGATKNAGLKQMAAALLAPGVTVLRNLHPVLDLDAMLDVMRAIGAGTEWTGENELTIDATGPLIPEAPYELVTRMRASINVLGPLLARCCGSDPDARASAAWPQVRGAEPRVDKSTLDPGPASDEWRVLNSALDGVSHTLEEALVR